MEESKIRHLDFVQLSITRMAANSFLLKGWCVTLTAGIFAVDASVDSSGTILYALLPVILFWGLDSYYLGLERAFRKLYDAIRLSNEPRTDFALNPVPYKDQWAFWSALRSVTEAGFYLPIAATILVIAHCI